MDASRLRLPALPAPMRAMAPPTPASSASTRLDELPMPNVVPMVALVIGATSPIGARVAACLATHGARLALVGDRQDKPQMEQVARLAACLGSPIVDVHEVDLAAATAPAAAARQGPGRHGKGGGSGGAAEHEAEEAAGAGAGEAAEQAEVAAKQRQEAGEGPPTETLAMVAETVLSRQGRVDILVSCPLGESPKVWTDTAAPQLAATQALVSHLATVMLAPPGTEHQAVITVASAANRQLRQWARDLPQHVAAAAAHNDTGTSGPSAEGLSDAERAAAAADMLALTLVLPEAIDMADMPHLSRALCEELVAAFKGWRLPPKQESKAASTGPREVLLAAPPTEARVDASAALASTGSSKEGDGAISVLHTLRGLLFHPTHPQQRRHDGSTTTTTTGDTSSGTGSAASGRPSAPAAAEAPGPPGTPPPAGSAAAHQQEDAAAAMTDAAEHGARSGGEDKGSDGDKGGGEGSGCLAGLLRGGGGGTQLLSVEQEDALLQQALSLLTSEGGAGDPRAAKVQGRDPSPRTGATCRAADDAEALWVDAWEDSMHLSGIILATGRARHWVSRLLSRPRYGPGELLRSPAALPGVVLTPADPNNLEPDAGKAYRNDPPRHPAFLVHCFKPFNGETPHRLLADEFLTPPELFYVRNHLSVPTDLKAEGYTFELSGVGVSGSPQGISLDDLKAGKWGPVIKRQATLQCAGNRRSEMAAVKLVEGRAPWNHGSIGNAEFTGVELRGLLMRADAEIDKHTAAASFDLMDKQDALLGLGRRLHVVMEGWDAHHESGTHFETSISLDKVLDARGGVMLSWAMNGKDLLPDHGFPLRVVVPGYVGTRSVKWLRRMTISEQESKSAWQQKDYKLLPQRYTTLSAAEFCSMPPIMDMNTQSAILLPEPGSIIDGGATCAVWFKGYAWCGAGLPITRVDVSADEGATWEVADITQRHTDEPTGRTWSWVKWQVPLQIPPAIRASGGKWRVCCKAFNANGDTQPTPIASVWNLRGLACNAWHFVDLAVTA